MVLKATSVIFSREFGKSSFSGRFAKYTILPTPFLVAILAEKNSEPLAIRLTSLKPNFPLYPWTGLVLEPEWAKEEPQKAGQKELKEPAENRGARCENGGRWAPIAEAMRELLQTSKLLFQRLVEGGSSKMSTLSELLLAAVLGPNHERPLRNPESRPPIIAPEVN